MPCCNVGWFILTQPNNLLCSITAYKDPQNVTVNNSQTFSNSAYILSPGPGGYQALDGDVASTLIRKGNYYHFGAAIPLAENLGSEALPDSLFRNEKPAWFGSLAWPAFDPTSPAPSYLSIPAGFRYVTGADPTSSTDPALSQKPLNVRILP